MEYDEGVKLDQLLELMQRLVTIHEIELRVNEKLKPKEFKEVAEELKK